jgi:hypothetical protein
VAVRDVTRDTCRKLTDREKQQKIDERDREDGEAQIAFLSRVH